VYKAVQESIPAIARYRAKEGTEDLGEMPIQRLTKKIWPEIYRVPIFRRQYCKMLCEEIDNMRRVIGFEPNAGEDELRQIPEIVLKEHVPELVSKHVACCSECFSANHLLAIPKRSERDRQRADCQLQLAR
jgi:hypothetical protein